jgi:mono/diheme cytochrome c family protein
VREDQVFEEGTPEQIAAGAEIYLLGLSRHWLQAEARVVAPKANPFAEGEARRASVLRGFKLFTEPGDAGCIACHADFGRQSTLRYDDWGMIVKPTDLTRPYYRGGRRPIDLYWRVATGINGVGMPAFGKKDPNAAAGLTEDQVWDIVNFVQILPYPPMLKEYGIELTR